MYQYHLQKHCSIHKVFVIDSNDLNLKNRIGLIKFSKFILEFFHRFSYLFNEFDIREIQIVIYPTAPFLLILIWTVLILFMYVRFRRFIKQILVSSVTSFHSCYQLINENKQRRWVSQKYHKISSINSSFVITHIIRIQK